MRDGEVLQVQVSAAGSLGTYFSLCVSHPPVERKMASTMLLHVEINTFVDLVQRDGFAV